MPDNTIGVDADLNKQANSSSVTGGLTDPPEKSALEQAVPPKDTGSASASSSMPEAAPASEIQGDQDGLSVEQSVEETATVPDTDKFLESILNSDDADGTVEPTGDSSVSPLENATAEVVEPIPTNNTNTDTSNPSTSSPLGDVGEQAGKDSAIAPDTFGQATNQGDTSQPNVEVSYSSPPPPENAFGGSDESQQASNVPVQGDHETGKFSSTDGVNTNKGLDGVVNGITPPEEPAKSVMENPSAMIPPRSPKTKSSRLLIIVLLVLAIVVAGYLAYTSFFAAQDSYDSVSVDDSANTDEAEEYTTQTNDEVRKNDLADIYSALRSYYSATGKYPVAESRVSLNSSDNILEKELVSAGYINLIPADPDAEKYYAYKSDGITFSLTAVLDDPSDPEATVINSMAIYEITQETVTASDDEMSVSLPDQTLSGDDSVEADAQSNPFYPAGTEEVIN